MIFATAVLLFLSNLIKSLGFEQVEVNKWIYLIHEWHIEINKNCTWKSGKNKSIRLGPNLCMLLGFNFQSEFSKKLL